MTCPRCGGAGMMLESSVIAKIGNAFIWTSPTPHLCHLCATRGEVNDLKGARYGKDIATTVVVRHVRAGAPG